MRPQLHGLAVVVPVLPCTRSERGRIAFSHRKCGMAHDFVARGDNVDPSLQIRFTAGSTSALSFAIPHCVLAYRYSARVLGQDGSGWGAIMPGVP